MHLASNEDLNDNVACQRLYSYGKNLDSFGANSHNIALISCSRSLFTHLHVGRSVVEQSLPCTCVAPVGTSRVRGESLAARGE